jgi:glucose-1-phosphate thymidylyltransferase
VGDTAEEIKDAVGDGSRWEARITYIQQEAPLGLAHAVKISQDFLGDERFVMFLGDNVIESGISSLVRQFQDSDSHCQIVLTRVPHPEQYGVAELEDGRIVRLVEKPRQPKSDLALVGIYMFDHHVFEAVNAITPSWRGELEITDAIQYLVDKGYQVHRKRGRNHQQCHSGAGHHRPGNAHHQLLRRTFHLNLPPRVHRGK